MKKSHILLALLFVALALLFWLHNRTPNERATQRSELVESNAPALPSRAPPRPPDAAHAATPPAAPSPQSKDNAAMIENRLNEMKAETEKGLEEWKTPIEFYGKVVDESTNPIPDAQVDFVWNDLSAEGTSRDHTTSDASGSFSLTGIKGKAMTVKVGKEGYYAYQPVGLAFNYAGENHNFVPDAANPVIFRLKKKGIAEPLIHFDKGFSVPKDGAPVEIDLTTGRQTSSSPNAIKVECWTHDTEKKSGWEFDWKCRVSIPGGELQSYNEMFPFLAPEGGYVPADEIDMTVKADTPWTQDVQRNYFVRTAGGAFGRLTFRMIAHGDHFCRIDSYFNPSGSRSLEFDPNNGIRAGN